MDCADDGRGAGDVYGRDDPACPGADRSGSCAARSARASGSGGSSGSAATAGSAAATGITAASGPTTGSGSASTCGGGSTSCSPGPSFGRSDLYSQEIQRSQQDVLLLQLPRLLKNQVDQLAQAQTPAPAPPPSPPPPSPTSDIPLHVDVTSIRLTTISIPLDPSGQFDIFGRITTPERKFVTSFDEQTDHQSVVEKQIPLEAGTYELRVLVRDRNNGRISTQQINFAVK